MKNTDEATSPETPRTTKAENQGGGAQESKGGRGSGRGNFGETGPPNFPQYYDQYDGMIPVGNAFGYGGMGCPMGMGQPMGGQYGHNQQMAQGQHWADMESSNDNGPPPTDN